MGEKINFPNANKAQNKILNKIKEQKEKEAKAKKDDFDEQKDREEFLYLWKHFDRRLRKILNDFKDDLHPKGYHGLEVLIKVKKDGASDDIKEEFIFSDKLKLYKITEIE
jgi:hypothetical protein